MGGMSFYSGYFLLPKNGSFQHGVTFVTRVICKKSPVGAHMTVEMPVETQEKRREERIATALPVILGDVPGVTRDVSATGVFFETDADLAVGAAIHFTLDIDTPAGKRVLKCQGQIIRTEARDRRVGVAVKILDSTLLRPY